MTDRRYDFIAVYPNTKKLFTERLFQTQIKLNRRVTYDELLLSLLNNVELE